MKNRFFVFAMLLFCSFVTAQVQEEALIRFLEQREIVPQDSSFILQLDKSISRNMACLLLVRTMRYIAWRYRVEVKKEETLRPTQSEFEAIRFLYAKNLFPDQMIHEANHWITRAEFVTLLTNSLNYLVPGLCQGLNSSIELFRDLSPTHFARESATCMIALKAIKIPSDRLFLGSQELTSLECFQILYRLVVCLQDLFRSNQSTVDNLKTLQRGF